MWWWPLNKIKMSGKMLSSMFPCLSVHLSFVHRCLVDVREALSWKLGIIYLMAADHIEVETHQIHPGS